MKIEAQAASESQPMRERAQTSVEGFSTDVSGTGTASCPGCPDVRAFSQSAALPQGYSVASHGVPAGRTTQERLAEMHEKLATK